MYKLNLYDDTWALLLNEVLSGIQCLILILSRKTELILIAKHT